jgi:hypothetical protein
MKQWDEFTHLVGLPCSKVEWCLLIILIIQDMCPLAEQMIMWCESRNLFMQMKMWYLSSPSVIWVIRWECHLGHGIAFWQHLSIHWIYAKFILHLLTDQAKEESCHCFFRPSGKSLPALLFLLDVITGDETGLCIWPWNGGEYHLCTWRALGKFIQVWKHTDLFFNILGIVYVNSSCRNKSCVASFVHHRCSAVFLEFKLAWNGSRFNDITPPEQ